MSLVVIKDCIDYKIDLLTERINSGIELLGGWNKFISPGMTVLLKVNLIGPMTAESGAVTHSEFVRAVTRILIGQKCIVWIGDSSGGAIAGIAPTAKSLAVSGMTQAAEEEGASIKNFDKEGVVEAAGEYSGKMYLAKPLFDADLVINLPKLKTHSAGIYTGAVKNMFGCVPGLKKADYHRIAPDPKELGYVIADINKAVNAGLHIMDGITAMQGEGPTAGEIYHAGKILFSTDPLALDTVAASMLGFKVEDIPILMSAKERGIGESSTEKIEIAGDYNSPPVLAGFKHPKRYKSYRQGNYQMMVKLIEFLKARPRIKGKLCRNCNMCVESCPKHAINKATKEIDYNSCIECMCCHELCLHKAVELKKDNRLAEILMRFYRGKYSKAYKNSDKYI